MGLISSLLLILLVVLSGVLPRRFRGGGVKVFYLGVLPAVVAAEFTIIQYSPSPADSIGQIIECLVELSAICLCVTLPVTLLVMQKSVRHAVMNGRALWWLLGIAAGVLLLRNLFSYHGSFPFSQLGIRILELWTGIQFTHVEFVVGAGLALFTILGLLLRWGPIIPCAFLGVIVVQLLLDVFVGASGAAYEVAVAYPLAVKRDFGIILFGTIGGALTGAIMDCRQRITLPQNEKGSGEIV